MRSDRIPATAFLVGLRYPHHARHSGYDRFAEHLGHWVRAPIRARWFPGRTGTAVNRALSAAVGQPKYSVSVLLAEVAAAAHMLRRENSLYHVMYGDRDLLLLRFLAGRSGNRLIATFHGPLAVPAASLEWLPGTLDAAILVSEYQRSYFESLLPSDLSWCGTVSTPSSSTPARGTPWTEPASRWVRTCATSRP